MDYQEEGASGEGMDLSAASTTIDPSVIQSRILQSTSLQKEHAAAMMEEDDDNMQQQQPVFPKLSAAQASGNKIEYRRVRCPPHRYTPLRENWEQILTPLVEYLKLQVGVPHILQRSQNQYTILAKEEETRIAECSLCCSSE